MLAAPTPPIQPIGFFDAMEHRGRSRAIPHTAVLRMHHQHQQQLYSSPCRRNANIYPFLQYNNCKPYHQQRSRSVSLVRPLSPSPDSTESLSPESTTSELITPPEPALDYYDSPPTPPHSLEDQIQEAYALDNIHLAKVLYLKLKGIEVLNDSDPRIDQVRDEDFPFSRLVLDEEDQRSLKEYQKREEDRRREQQRECMLEACELIWTRSVTQYREERLKVVRQKEAAAFAAAEQKRLQAEAKDREALEQERSRIQYFKQGGLSTRGLLSYKSLGQHRLSQSSSPPDSEFVFEYTIMRPSSAPCPSYRRKSVYSKSRDSLMQSSSSCSVPFRDVSASMRGALFPFQPDEDAIYHNSRAGKRVRLDLLEVLLDPVQWADGERRRTKGKDKESFSTWSSSDRTLCAACSAASKPTSFPGTLVQQSISWIRFGSRNTKITSSSITPDTQSFHPRRGVPVMVSAMASSSSEPVATKPLRHSCHRSNLIPVLPEECPLSTHASHSQDNPIRPPRPSESSSRSFIPFNVVKRMGGSISSFFDLASQLQATYMRATAFSVAIQTETIYRKDLVAQSGTSKSRSSSSSSLDDERLGPVGFRAKASDVVTFAGRYEDDEVENAGSVPLIPIFEPVERRSLHTPTITSAAHIIPSPLRPREPPKCLQYRIRPIANPVMLRLKALQNVCFVEKMEWEGRAKEGALGFGKERMAGVAFEGIGRSGLKCEVS